MYDMLHQRRSIRLKGYDYSQAGLYFITICCQNRFHRFGKVVDGKMILNEYGLIAHNAWLKTPELRPNVELGEFIIMPDHMHGIIRLLGTRGELHSPETELYSPATELHSPATELHSVATELHSVETELHSPATELHSAATELHSVETELQLLGVRGVCKTPLLRGPSNNVGAIVRGFKSSVTKHLGLIGLIGKLWQRNYYERIIRSEQAHQNISRYIINNPAKWTQNKIKINRNLQNRH